MGHATELVALLPAPLPPWGVLRRARHCCDHRSLTHRLSHPGSNAQSPYLSMAIFAHSTEIQPLMIPQVSRMTRACVPPVAHERLCKLAPVGVSPNVVSYNSALAACAKRRDGSAAAAHQLLHEMRCTTVSPTIISFNSAIVACAKQRDGTATAALELLRKMVRTGISPSIISYSSAIEACAKQRDGSAAAAHELLRKMTAAGISPNVISYSSSNRGVCQAARRLGGSGTPTAA